MNCAVDTQLLREDQSRSEKVKNRPKMGRQSWVSRGRGEWRRWVEMNEEEGQRRRMRRAEMERQRCVVVALRDRV